MYYHRRPKAHPLVGIILLIFLALAGFGFWKFFQTGLPFSYKNVGRINVAVAGKQVALVSLDQTGNSAVVVKIPDNLYLPNLIHGYGQYPAASVYPAGEFDRKGGETLAGTLQEFLGVPVDGYYYTLQNFSDLKGLFLSPDFLLGKNSNLSLWRKINLVKDLFGLRFDKIKTVDLAGFANSLVLADGSLALSLEPAEVDQALSGLFGENNLQGENLRVEVINTTKMNGLAARAGRLLSNLGLTVVNLDGTADPVAKCKITAEKGTENSKTVARIARIYTCTVETKENSAGRAAVSVFLGQNYADWLTK